MALGDRFLLARHMFDPRLLAAPASHPVSRWHNGLQDPQHAQLLGRYPRRIRG